MKTITGKIILLLTLLCITESVIAQEVYIPSALKPWKNWVLQKNQEKLCPVGQDAVNTHICSWPASLTLNLTNSGGTFQGLWSVFQDGMVVLPGGNGQWPMQVKVNNRLLPVGESHGKPTVWLNKGTHKIKGAFEWTQLPLRLTLPKEIGTISLTLQQRKVPFPKFNEKGELWIKNNATVGGKNIENLLSIKVFRVLEDSIPMMDNTILKLNVSGQEREIIIDQILLEGFQPLSYDSALPLQLTQTGKLKIQVRAGEWLISIRSRNNKPAQKITFPEKRGILPLEELWMFKEQHNNRYVKISGASQIDSKLVDLPSHFQNLPAYLLKKGKELVFTETSRGLSRLDEDHLSLNRVMWLDFNGDGFTVQDQIQGDVNQTWRFEMSAPYQLGSAKVKGKNQLITHIDQKGTNGVEIREGDLQMETESRFENNSLFFPSIGWNIDFKSIEGEINIPPGWRVIALLGADSSYGTWLSKWNLLNLFFILIVSLSISKIKNVKWGIVTFIGLALLIHEDGAPFWVWLHILIAWAISIGLKKEGKISKFITYYRVVALLILCGISFVFVVSEVQKTIYPSLEQQSHRTFYSRLGTAEHRSFSSGPRLSKSKGQPTPKPQRQSAVEEEVTEELLMLDEAPMPSEKKAAAVSSFKPLRYSASRSKARDPIPQYDQNAKIQTGPGLPNWRWGTVSYKWEGPVQRDQELRLIALSPPFKKIHTAVKILFLFLLIVCFLDLNRGNILKPKQWDITKKLFQYLPFLKGTAALFLCFSLLTPTDGNAQEFPRAEILAELQSRLLEKPKCLPKCISISNMDVIYAPKQMTIRLKVHSQGDVYFSLPGNRDQWYPDTVLFNGKKAKSIANLRGQLAIFVPKGIHNVLLRGAMPKMESINLNLPLLPNHASFHGKGWSVQGIKKSGEVDNNLQFTRYSSSVNKRKDYKGSKLSDFFRVERKLLLRMTWKVQTKVIRLSPANKPTVIRIPLIQGESITSSEVRSEKKQAIVNFAKGQELAEWTSSIAEFTELKLITGTSQQYFEQWEVQPGYIWNAAFSGIPMIANKDYSSQYAPRWKPWPNEKVTVKVTKPNTTSGSVLTLDKTSYKVHPGQRHTTHELNLSLITSIGLTHTITLPENSKLDSVHINGSSQSLSLNGNTLALPLGIGKQNVRVEWTSTEGISTFFRTEKLDLGIVGINLKTEVIMPESRWIIAVGGPALGPAVLFWGKLIGLLCISFLLSKLSWSRLSFLEWGLLVIGLTQGYTLGIFIVMGYLLMISFRESHDINRENHTYNLTQFFMILWSAVTIGVFWYIIQAGLLGGPRMDIAGNLSNASHLNWYSDRFDEVLPTSFVLSFPTYIFQIAMLLWSIWAALSITRWSAWIWKGLYLNGFYHEVKKIEKQETEVKVKDDAQKTKSKTADKKKE